MSRAVVLQGDARSLPLPDASVDLICTSPPYFGLRQYVDGGAPLEGQIGSEATPADYIDALLECTREWMRVLKPSGSLFVNLGDKYSQRVQVRRSSHQPGIFPGKFPEFGETWAERAAQGATRMPHQNIVSSDGGYVPEKSLIGLPWRYALGCVDQLGLILRRDIIWHKSSGLPESVTDRCATRHEYLFHFTLRPRYFAAVDEIREPHAEVSIRRSMPHRSPPGRRDAEIYNGQPSQTLRLDQMNNPLGKLPGSVWEIPPVPLIVPESLGIDHFAAFPPALVRLIVLGWSPVGICTDCWQGRRPVAPVVAAGSPVGRAHRHLPGYRDPAGIGRREPQRIITGYACACPQPLAPTRPALVLDPFCGTGTTMLTASVLGRVGIGVDRSADYCRLATWRVNDPAERARALGVPKPPPVPDGQDALFGFGEVPA